DQTCAGPMSSLASSPQRLLVETKDCPVRITEQLATSLRGYRQMLAETDKVQTRRIDSIEDISSSNTSKERSITSRAWKPDRHPIHFSSKLLMSKALSPATAWNSV